MLAGGYEPNGTLGIGEYVDSAAGGSFSSPGYIGWAYTSMDNLPAVNFGTGRTAQAVVASTSTTCVLMDNNKVGGLYGAIFC